jgi:hypothetical protein
MEDGKENNAIWGLGFGQAVSCILGIKLLTWIREYLSWKPHYHEAASVWRSVQGVKDLQSRALKYTQAKTSGSRDGDQDHLMTRKQLQWSWKCSKLARNLKMFGTQMYPVTLQSRGRDSFEGGSSVTSWNFSGMLTNAKLWISKFLFEIECLPKL